jgi:hypothetical protein
MELLKQGAQRERRPERAVRHDWYRLIARTVDLPVQDNGAGIALVALLAALPRPSYRTRAAWAPRARDELQSSEPSRMNPVGYPPHTRLMESRCFG